MIYITGDMHGDIERFKQKKLKKLRRGDTLIVCGDFGFLWDSSKKEQKTLRWIGKRRYHTLFMEGTHDNMELLSQYPQKEWNGGLVREISGRLRYLCRGQIFRIEDSDIFAFGGGESTDADFRDLGQVGQEQGLPTLAEIEEARQRLAAHGNHVDYIVTHQASRKIGTFLLMDKHDPNVLDTFLDEVRADCQYKRWFFGRYHINKTIPPAEIALFDAVIPVTAGKVNG